MLVVVTGGSGSGKSVYAEQLLAEQPLTEAGKTQKVQKKAQKYYIATMKPFGSEGQERIARHQKQRQGGGFITVEQYTQIEKANIPPGETVNALLECMSNLVANEMFDDNNTRSVEELVRDITGGIEKLYAHCRHLVIVTNEVSSDGNNYDRETMEYIRCLGAINQHLAKIADSVVEVVYSIPVKIKGENKNEGLL